MRILERKKKKQLSEDSSANSLLQLIVGASSNLGTEVPGLGMDDFKGAGISYYGNYHSRYSGNTGSYWVLDTNLLR